MEEKKKVEVKKAAPIEVKPSKKEFNFDTNTFMYTVYVLYKLHMLHRGHLKAILNIVKDDLPEDVIKYLVVEAAMA